MLRMTPAAAGPAFRFMRESPSRAQENSPIIQICNLEKTYRTARGALTLFQGLDLTIAAGELVAIVGQSGAGKSTFLHILGALDAPSAGTVHCASTNVATLNAREAAAFRNREIGYVWQFHYLLPEFSAVENVAMPLLARGISRREALDAASKWLKEVDLEERTSAGGAFRWRTAARSAGAGLGWQSSAASGRRTHWRSGRDDRRARF
jgi:lipoprotein-releasing system ATP-binding protein